MEFELLWLLASQAGEILSRDEILNQIRGIGFDGLNRSVDVCISKLRNKLRTIRASRSGSRPSGARATCSTAGWEL